MNNQINQILKDLYAIDPKLRDHEQELIKITKKLLKSRPDTKFDASFARKLRANLMVEANEIKNSAPLSFRRRGAGGEVWSIFNFMLTKKHSYALGGLAVIVLLVASVFFFNTREKATQFAFNVMEISQLENNAFGSLSSTQSLDEEAEVARSQAGGASIGAGGGGALAPSFSSDSAVASKEIAIMPAPDIVNYNYVYKGEDFSIDSTQMEVYKQLKSSSAGQDLAKYISQVKTGLVDLEKFKNTSISNLNITEDREFGYTIYLDLINNHISINMNWEKWPQPEAKCAQIEREAARKCYDSLRLTIDDIPEDDAIIKIANDFVKEYEINMDSYGKPQIQDQWRQNYLRAKNKAQFYVPDTITVVYSLLINGQEVSDQSGNPHGLNVNINIRHKKASGIYNLRAQNFQSSNYDVIVDSQKIINLAEDGGLWKQWINPQAKKTVDIELGTPTLGLILHNQYDQAKRQSNELYVPAYIFPILNKTIAGYFYRQNIVVPLVKELFERGDDIIGIPRPMPMEEPVMLEGAESGKETTVKSVEIDK